ncbi:FlgB family protein [Rhodobacter sp. TJ_12]|uniref:FlgB family protein n=1 Tax=Rhodobacter sp. TJ_12 TaxID=2029399 RepID=UPI0021D904D5|nr:FlgB family protein [Rhodobacter sp. TJ_12]
MAQTAALSQSAIATNIANADTPGYQAREVASFAETYRSDSGANMRATRAGHLGGEGRYHVEVRESRDTNGASPDGNSVSIEDEMVAAVRAKSQHDRAIAIYKSSLGILRASLGRS